MHVFFNKDSVIAKRQEQEDENIRLIRNSNGEGAVKLEIILQKGTCDGPSPSN